MLEFLNNLFAGANQQIPSSLANPDPENPNSFGYAQRVYDRQIAPWMRAGIQSPMDQLQFEPVASPEVDMEQARARQQQELLKQYALANMARAGGQSGIIEQQPAVYPDDGMPPFGGYPPGMDPRSPENLLKRVAGGAQARTFPVEMNQLPEPTEIPKEQSSGNFLETMFSSGQEPMLSQMMRAAAGQDTGVDVSGAQAAPMTREAMGYVPTGIETLIPGASTMGIDFRNVVMNPARKRLSNLLGIQ